MTFLTSLILHSLSVPWLVVGIKSTNKSFYDLNNEKKIWIEPPKIYIISIEETMIVQRTVLILPLTTCVYAVPYSLVEYLKSKTTTARTNVNIYQLYNTISRVIAYIAFS